jgi:hypothetical protein
MGWHSLQDYGMLTIVNQQPDITALQVWQICKCCVHHSVEEMYPALCPFMMWVVFDVH